MSIIGNFNISFVGKSTDKMQINGLQLKMYILKLGSRNFTTRTSQPHESIFFAAFAELQECLKLIYNNIDPASVTAANSCAAELEWKTGKITGIASHQESQL